AQRDRTQGLGLITLAVAHEAPHLAVGLRHQAAMLQVFPEARLVDGADGAETHRHGRRLPEVRHEPWMWVARNSLAADFHAEGVELFQRQAAFEEGARIDARARMTLDVQQVTGMRRARRAPEMIEAHVVQHRARRERRNVTAKLPWLA